MFAFVFLGDTEKNIHKLHVLNTCLKLDENAYYKAAHIPLPQLPLSPAHPNDRVAEVLSNLLEGDGCFSRNVQLPHNYHIGMSFPLFCFIFKLYSVCPDKGVGDYRHTRVLYLHEFFPSLSPQLPLTCCRPLSDS